MAGRRFFLFSCVLLAFSFSAKADDNLIELVKKTKSAVVLIQTFNDNNQPIGQGSGFFVNNKGHIVTNYHVIEGAYRATVKTSSGIEYPVEGIIAKNADADIVKLIVNIPDANTPFLNLSEIVPSEGQDIVVIGNPLGFESTVSPGIVSAVRDIPAFGKILQITAPISPGSSGSPVINSKGEVIGIATLVLKEGQNLNFAITSDKIIALKETSQTPIFEANAAYDIELYHDKVFDVVIVVDGSTFDINFPDGSKPYTRIRLWGIDTSWTDNLQTDVTYFGPEATAFTRQLALGKSVTIYLDKDRNSRDKYHRLLAYVQLPDKTFLNEVLLSEGYAYADLRFKHSFYHKYQHLEAVARSQSKGLWANVKADKMSNKFTSSENTFNLDNAKPIAYHSPEGHFSLTIPAGWEEIPRDAIEATLKLLQEQNSSISALNRQNYDGAFQKTSTTYFTYPYVLFAMDKKGRWPEREIEKFVSSDEWEKGAQKGLRTVEKQLPNLIQNLKLGQTTYDKRRNILFIKVESEVFGIGKVIALTSIIPSNYGTVNLHCYSTKDSFENDLPIFTQIIDSFRYDIGYEYNQFTKNQSSDTASGSLWGVVLTVFICVGLATLVIIIIVRKSSSKSNNFPETLQASVQPSDSVPSLQIMKEENIESSTLASFGEESMQMVLASSWQRFGTMLLDTIFYFIFAFIFGIVSYLIGLGDLIQNMNNNILGIIILIIYYVPQEAFSGRTLGKLITGTKAVSEDGTNLTFGQALGRTLCRFIPFEAFSFLGGRGMPRGWHDKIPKTKVISLRRT